MSEIIKRYCGCSNVMVPSFDKGMYGDEECVIPVFECKKCGNISPLSFEKAAEELNFWVNASLDEALKILKNIEDRIMEPSNTDNGNKNG